MSRVVALCGGVGGAKLAFGLDRIVAPGRLTVIVNTGDDFEHLGLHISPDVDTVLYTLGGLADRERGWGRTGETWNFMSAIRQLGREDWFLLGDQDLALHVARSQHLALGRGLSTFVDDIARRVGIAARVLPMTDDRVRTVVDTDIGALPFQRYFVERRCEPVVRALRFDGAATARPAAGVLEAITDPGLDLIVVCPSNPYLSIDPILAVPGIRQALVRTSTPVVAVSPIIGGRAIKGPTVKIMEELGIAATNRSIAAHYADVIDALVIDNSDNAELPSLGIPVLTTQTLMRDDGDRQRLAAEVIAFGRSLRAAAAVAVAKTP
jgi:LPPG:FO 2-phospho-L-lactate transferase